MQLLFEISCDKSLGSFLLDDNLNRDGGNCEGRVTKHLEVRTLWSLKLKLENVLQHLDFTVPVKFVPRLVFQSGK